MRPPDTTPAAPSQDKEAKINYLTKIIKCVEHALSITINIRVGKVVAGLEAENTNAFLQSLFQAATSVPDSSTAVSKVLAELGGGDAEPPPPPQPAAADPYGAPPPQAEPPQMDMPPPRREAPSAMPPPQMPPPLPPTDGGAPTCRRPTRATSAPLARRRCASRRGRRRRGRRPAVGGGGGEARAAQVARRPPPRVTSNEVRAEKPGGARDPGAGPVAGVILEGDGGGDDDHDTIEMVDQQGDAVNTASMAGGEGGPQGRLVRNMLAAKEEVEMHGRSERDRGDGGVADVSDADGGIILGGKKGTKGGAGGDAGGGKGATKLEISTLRQSIQTLCQSSNPLGRCLEYVQEDLEAMGKELESWRNLRHRRASELSDEEAVTASNLVSLKAELDKVEELIKEKHSQIRFAKASILRNDQQVERLLSQVVRGPA